MTTTRKRTSATPPAAAPDTTLLAFLDGWEEVQDGALTAGRSVELHYDPARLAASRRTEAAPLRDVVGFARFLPSGVVRHTVLRKPSGRRTRDAAARVAAEIAIPHETRQLELWFQGVAEDGATVWDSRFGHNYRFDVARPQPSAADTLPALEKAAVDPARVAIVQDAAVKANLFPSRPGFPSGRSAQETTLRVAARIAGATRPRRVWIATRGFDVDGRPISSDERDLHPIEGDSAQYAVDELLYHGAVATPGSVSPKPDMRLVQYRVYATIGRKTYTDGLLHRCELATDATSP